VRSLPVSAPTVPDAEALPVVIEENVKMQVSYFLPNFEKISNIYIH
jgi:hypothetical protein